MVKQGASQKTGGAMPTLATTVDGLKLPNPFVIGSGPPGTNLNVITRAFREGWGAVIAKTISLDSSKVINVTPRYAKLMADDGKDVVGWENIELISDRPFNIWLDEFKKCKDQFPDGILIASIMEEYNKDAWSEIVERCQDAGVDSFELNFSCPHGLPERKMGAAMGENPEIVEEVVGWVMAAAKKPVWAKMTPNVTRITDPSRAAFRGGCEGVSAINTIRSVMSVNLDTLRPEPSVEGYTTPGGYSCKAVRPIALRMVMEIATLIRREFPGKSLSAIGGVETGGDAAQFIA
jgi:dihydropyrimidine dehydrogenase (NADP+)/dihydropyrimidine dehydrogenase (NAD+) subunit PreA